MDPSALELAEDLLVEEAYSEDVDDLRAVSSFLNTAYPQYLPRGYSPDQMDAMVLEL